MPRLFASQLCKIPAIFGLILLFGTGCSLDKGSSGEIAPVNLFPLFPLFPPEAEWCAEAEGHPETEGCPEAEGCLIDNPDQSQVDTISFSVTIPFGLSLMEARLEVLRGDIDFVMGMEDPPSDYFSFGRGRGTQKVLVGQEYEPQIGRPWYVQLVSSFEIQECEEGVEPDWRLSVRRSAGSQGQVLLDQEVQVPACTTPGACDSSVSIPLQVPEDVLSMEVVLESVDWDADLLVGAGEQPERWSSLNLGPGYDVVVIDPEAAIPLRGQELLIVLESWQQTTDARLEVTYVPGEVDGEEPPAPL